MKKYLCLILFVFTMVFSKVVTSQTISHYRAEDEVKIDTLIDKKSGNKFILDKQRIFITATDKNGKLLWKTDPVIDNKIDKYKTDRPRVVYFSFGIEDTKDKREVIQLSYNNRQFGYLNKANGKFTFLGQD